MGFGINIDMANMIGVACALAAMVAFMMVGRRKAAVQQA